MSKKKTITYDDYIANKILAIFTAAFLLIIGMMLIYRGYRSFDTMFMTQKLVYFASGLLAACMITGVIWEVLGKKNDKDRYKLIRGRNLAIVAGVYSFCTFFAARFFVDGVKAMYIFVPILVVLSLVYIIYSFDFFLISIISSAGGIWMWVVSTLNYIGILRADAVAIVNSKVFWLSLAGLFLIVVAAFLAARLKRGGGEIYSKTLLNKSANYSLVFLSLAITAAAVLLAMVFGHSLAYYLIFALFGYLFILSVYYTVKLI